MSVCACVYVPMHAPEGVPGMLELHKYFCNAYMYSYLFLVNSLTSVPNKDLANIFNLCFIGIHYDNEIDSHACVHGQTSGI